MALTARDLEALTGAGVIDRETASRMAEFFADTDQTDYRFDLTLGAYYLGSLVVLWAMGWFMAETWSRYGGLVLMVTALAYGTAFLLGANTLWRRPGLRFPAGVLYVLTVGMVPLAVFGLQNALDFWPVPAAGNQAEFLTAIRWPRVILELSGIAVGLILMRLRPFALLALPVAFALWAMSIDLAVIIVPPEAGFHHFVTNNEITYFFGLFILGATFLIDRRTTEDYALWLYLSGMIAAWGAMTGDVGSAFYAVFNVAIIAVAVLLERPLIMIFGMIGIFAYLAYLAAEVFEDSVLFPLALVAIGIGIIAAGVWSRSNRGRIDQILIGAIPATIRQSLPRYRQPPQR